MIPQENHRIPQENHRVPQVNHMIPNGIRSIPKRKTRFSKQIKRPWGTTQKHTTTPQDYARKPRGLVIISHAITRNPTYHNSRKCLPRYYHSESPSIHNRKNDTSIISHDAATFRRNNYASKVRHKSTPDRHKINYNIEKNRHSETYHRLTKKTCYRN